MSGSTLYDVLGVPPDADRETIRRAYIDVAKRTHPDRYVEDPGRRAAAAELIRRANHAWNVLGDAARRAEYDSSLRVDQQPRSDRSSTKAGPSYVPMGSSAPSGIVVDQRLAPIWRWGPAIVVLLIGALILIVSAYATSTTDSQSTTTSAVTARPVVGDCVAIFSSDAGPIAETIDCSRPNSGRVSSIIDSPRPCPTASEAVPLADNRTTLCLVRP